MTDATPSTSSTQPIIRIEAVNKWYGSFQVLTDINLQVQAGERIVVCGPSGSGKSTLIRCINRLEVVQKGRIVVDGIDLTAGGKNVDSVRQEVGMVFQQFNLFPHLTILQNCTLAPMRSRGISKEEAETLAMKYLTRVRIPEQANKYPSQLSGGMQQRLAIAQALIMKPRVLLLDEPFGALDNQTRSLMQELLLGIWERERKTVLFVTHDVDEAVLLSDRIVMMTNGPAATIGEVLSVDLPRPRKRLELAHDTKYMDYRSAVIEFLYAKQQHPLAA